MRAEPLQLSAWLDHCVGQGLRIGLHERMLAHLLVSRLRLQRAWPDDLQARLRLLAPVLCRSAADQALYWQIIADYKERQRPRKDGASKVESGDGTSGNKQAADVFVKLAVWAVVVLVLASLFRGSGTGTSGGGRLIWRPQASAPTAVPIIEPAASSPPQTSLPSSEIPAAYAPPRHIPPSAPEPPPWLAPVKWAVGLLGLASALFTAWRLWRWHRRRLFAEAGALPEDSITRQVLRDPQARPLAGRPRVFGSVSRLLRQRVVTEALQLDARATVRTSVRRGGALALQFSPRTQLPEYLALVERSGERDHQSLYHEALVLALQQRGVPVELYFYRQNPGLGCWRLAHPEPGQDVRLPGPTLGLQTLLAQRPRHRLLVFGDAAAAVQQPGGTPADWTRELRPGRQRAWFTPLPLADWGATEHWVTSAKGLDFLLLPMEEAALVTLANWLAAGATRFQPDPRALGTYPPLLRDAPDAWAVRTVSPPAAVRLQLMAQIRAYLGDVGMQWLAACALFPLLAWPLTLALGRKLQTAVPQPGTAADPVDEEAALALGIGALAALPWFRQGRLPDWLRAELITTLPKELETLLRTELEDRLERAVAGQGSVVASVARQSSRQLLRQVLRRGDGVLADVLLLRFLQPALAPALVQKLPEVLRRWLFPKGAVLLGLRPSVAWLAALPMVLLVVLLPPVERRLQPAQHLPATALTDARTDPQLGAFALSPEGRSVLLLRAGASAAEPMSAVLATVTAPGASAPPVWIGPLGGARPLAVAAAGADQVAWLLDSGQRLQQLSAAQAQVLPERNLQLRRTLEMPMQGTAMAYAPGSRVVFVGTQNGQVTGQPQVPGASTFVQLPQGSAVQALAVRADGLRGASLHADLRVLLWDASDSAVPANEKAVALPATPHALAFSPDGQRLAVGLADGRVQLVSGHDGSALQLLAAEPSHSKSAVVALAFSPDGTRLAGGHAGGELTMWDLNRNVRVLRAKAGVAIRQMQYSPDGSTLWLLDATGRLQRAGAVPAAQAVAVLGCDDRTATPQQRGATQAVADQLSTALQAGGSAARVDVLWMPQAMWRAWGHGDRPPTGQIVLSPPVPAGQALGARVLAALQSSSAAAPASAASPSTTPAWRAEPVPQGLATVTVGTCDPLPTLPPQRLQPISWPADPADAQLQKAVDEALAGLWQANRAARPAATAALLRQPGLVSDALPRALVRAQGLADGQEPGGLGEESRVVQAVRLAQQASPVALQRNATAAYKLLDRVVALGGDTVAQREAERLRTVLQAAIGQAPQVLLVLGAGAGAAERQAAQRLLVDWTGRGIVARLAPTPDGSTAATSLQAAGASDRPLARWLLRQATAAQAGKAARTAAEQPTDVPAPKTPSAERAGDSYRLVLAPLPVVAAAASAAQPTSALPAASAVAVATASSAPREPRPGDRFRDCEDETLCPRMVVLPPGEFLMGSADEDRRADTDERPQHKVTIARPFAMMDTEVTRAQYAAFTRATNRAVPSRCESSEFQSAPNHPVICVSWTDAVAHAEWLSAQTGQRYRLPTEAEWEYAARAGSTTQYHFGDDPEQLCRYANVRDASASKIRLAGGVRCDDAFAYTSPVRSFRANAFGLYDMHGNVLEWVQDCWHDNYRGAPTDGSEWRADCSSDYRLLRGSAWDHSAETARAAIRFRDAPDSRSINRGFRLARAVSP